MDESTDSSRLKRPIHPMPDWMKAAIEARGLDAAYGRRPAYQQNDYVYWITSPKREETRQKRLGQMLDELESGGVYMRMTWNG